MKKRNILIIVLLAVVLGVVISSFGEFSTYESFASAAEKPNTTLHVIGVLDTEKEQYYDPIEDANHFTFFAADQKGETHQVVFRGPKPQDFDRSEQLVMTGRMVDDVFHCDKIQMKCPSKYEEDQIAVAQDANI